MLLNTYILAVNHTFPSSCRGTSYTVPASSICPRRASGLLGAGQCDLQPSQALRCHVPDTPHRADEALSVDALLGRRGSTSVSLTPRAIARFLVQIVESNDGEMFDYEKTEDAYDYLDDQFLPCVSHIDTPTAKAMGFLFLRPLHCRKDFSFT